MNEPEPSDELMFDSARNTPTGFELKTHAGGPQTANALLIMADSMRHALDDYDAKNYLEIEVRAGDGKQYVMTLQRRGGAVTPHEARVKAEAEVVALTKQLADLDPHTIWAEAYTQGIQDEITSQSNPGIAGCFCSTPSNCRCFIAPARVNPYPKIEETS